MTLAGRGWLAVALLAASCLAAAQDKCAIAHPDPSQVKFEYKLVRIKGDRLYLRDAAGGTQAVYKRIP